MGDETTERLDAYLKSLDQLYEKVQQWLHNKGFTSATTSIEIDEPRPGKYTVQKLTIFDPNEKPLAELVPKGAWIIGADWRVDVVGHLQNEVLVYWRHGAPELDMPELNNGVSRKQKLFKGADQEGWYWIEDKKFGRARRFNDQLLMDLISEVQPL